MLTNDLLKTKVTGKIVTPVLASETGKSFVLAQKVLQIIHEHMGKRRGELAQALQELSSIEVNHKLCKGLAKVAQDQCEFTSPTVEVKGDLGARELRRFVFEKAAKLGPISLHDSVPGRVAREKVLDIVAAELAVSSDAIIDFLYADQKEMEILTAPPKNQTPLGLIRRYNLALCQSILLQASCITLSIYSQDSRWLRLIFRRLKFYRLLFQVFQHEDRLEIKIDGPQSLLKQSSRYGFQFALFLPVLPLLEIEWRLSAELLWGKKSKTKKCFALDNRSSLYSHYTARGTWKSNTEEWFEERFLSQKREWELQEGAVLHLGEQQILIPNYSLVKENTIVYMDIIGFWRKSYLKDVVAKAPKNVIFAVSKKYSAEAKSLPKTIQNKVLIFSEVIPVNKIVELLNEISKNMSE